jgi:NitT/TauT family transport system permease protein
VSAVAYGSGVAAPAADEADEMDVVLPGDLDLSGPTPIGPTPSPRFVRRFASQLWPPLLVFAGLIALWYSLNLRLPAHRRFLLPTPVEVVKGGILDGEAFGQIMASTWLTTRLALTGLTIAIGLGMLLGVAMYRSNRVERAAYPYLVALQAVPILAITPLMIIAFGSGSLSKTLVCVIISFFPIPTNLLLGLKSIDKGMIDLFRMQGASWTTRLRKLALPAATPALFTGFRISAGLSVIGAIVGELFFQQGEPGLGLRLVEYRQRIEFDRMYSCLIWSSLLGIAVFMFFGWLGNRIVRSWHESAS